MAGTGAGHDDGAVPTVGESIIPRPGMRYRTGLGGEPHERPTARCRDRAGAHRRANQSLLHLVAQTPWSDAAILRRVRECVLPSVTREEPIQAWIIDDTGYPKACPWA